MSRPRVSWLAVALVVTDDLSKLAIGATIELLARARLDRRGAPQLDWTGFDLACREHDGPWARQWLALSSYWPP